MSTVYEMGAILVAAPLISITLGFITHELFRRWINE